VVCRFLIDLAEMNGTEVEKMKEEANKLFVGM
jgi:hypothetical protein